MYARGNTIASLRRRVPTTRFITFSCTQRKFWLDHPVVRDALARLIAGTTLRDEIKLHAWVIMSNHVHLLATDSRLPVLVCAARLRKQFALHERPKFARILPTEARKGPFWLRGGGHSRVIWSWQEYQQKYKYIHANPVRANLCARMSAWKWSSVIDARLEPRVGMPVLSPEPEWLIDLLWWKQP